MPPTNNKPAINTSDKADLAVYISADMEGVAGIVSPVEVWETGGEFERGRLLLTEEINAAAKASFDQGASRVLVNDAHMYMQNILIDRLDSRVEIIRGSRKLGFMMHGIESERFDIALLLGYHAMAGTPNGILCHTFSSQWGNLYFNNTQIGEVTYNAAYAANFGCPIGMVTGDEALSQEVFQNLGWAEYISVKEGIGRFSGKNISITESRKRIYDGTTRAINKLKNGELKHLIIPFPLRVAIDYHQVEQADLAELLVNIERISSLRVEFQAANTIELSKTIMNLFLLSSR